MSHLEMKDRLSALVGALLMFNSRNELAFDKSCPARKVDVLVTLKSSENTKADMVLIAVPEPAETVSCSAVAEVGALPVAVYCKNGNGTMPERALVQSYSPSK